MSSRLQPSHLAVFKIPNRHRVEAGKAYTRGFPKFKVRVFYLLVLAIPLACLALLSLLAFLGVLTLAGTLSVVSTVQAGLRYVAKRARRRDGATEAR